MVLDLCSRQPGDVAGTERGVLTKHIVSKGDSRRLGVPGYRLARKSRWGDLWPAPFSPLSRSASFQEEQDPSARGD